MTTSNKEEITFDPNTKTSDMYSEEKINEMRKKKQDIDKWLPEIERKSQKCHHLKEKIEEEKKKIKEIQIEMELSQQKKEENRKTLASINGTGHLEDKGRIQKLKEEIINQKLKALLFDKLPETGISNMKRAKNEKNENEFYNLIQNNIEVIYTVYDSSTTTTATIEEKQKFNISNNTQFKSLKNTACNFWNISNVNDYYLTDETEAIIHDEDMKIDEFITLYSVRCKCFKLIHISLLKARNKVLPFQEHELQKKNLFNSKEDIIVKKSFQGLSMQYVNEFINQYIGLKSYFLKKDENAVEREILNSKKQARELDTSFIMLVLMIVFMSLTIAFIYRDERNTRLNNKRFLDLSAVNLDSSYMFDTRMIMDYIKELKNLESLKRFHDMIMIVSKVKTKNCEDSYDNLKQNLTGKVCYHSRYSRTNKQKEENCNMKSESESETATYSDSKVHLNLQTLGGDFDGSGFYFYDFLPMSDCLLQPDIRGITFIINYYFPNEDIFANVLVHFDHLPTGMYYRGAFEIRSFIPNIYKNGYLAYDIVRFIIIVLMIALTLIENFIKSKRKMKEFFMRINFVFILLILIFILFLSSFIIKNVYCKKDEKEFFTKVQDNDGYIIAKMEYYSYYLECILLIFVIIRGLLFFKLLNFMNLLFSSITTTINMFIQYLIVMLALLFGFAVIAELIWSPHLKEFETFGMSFISILFFTCGFYDVSGLIKHNEAWGIIFILLFFIFDLFLIFAIFNSIFAESLRRTIVNNGYPEDIEKGEWNLKDFSFWMVHYLSEENEKSKTGK